MSKNAFPFVSAAEVIGWLRETIAGEILTEVLWEAAKNDVGFF